MVPGGLPKQANTVAMDRLGDLFSEKGRAEEAEQWYRRAAQAGSQEAMTDSAAGPGKPATGGRPRNGTVGPPKQGIGWPCIGSPTCSARRAARTKLSSGPGEASKQARRMLQRALGRDLGRALLSNDLTIVRPNPSASPRRDYFTSTVSSSKAA